jgi:hypothetical protein
MAIFRGEMTCFDRGGAAWAAWGFGVKNRVKMQKTGARPPVWSILGPFLAQKGSFFAPLVAGRIGFARVYLAAFSASFVRSNREMPRPSAEMLRKYISPRSSSPKETIGSFRVRIGWLATTRPFAGS